LSKDEEIDKLLRECEEILSILARIEIASLRLEVET
jgi:hypothetical protein